MTLQDKINKYKRALLYLRLARQELKDIAIDEHFDDAKFFANQISEIISCDNGQAGIERLIKRLEN